MSSEPAPPPAPRGPLTVHPMHFAVRPKLRILRRVFVVLLATLIFLSFAVIVLIKTDWFAEQVREIVEREVGQLLDAEVRIGRLSFTLLPTSLVVEDVFVRKRGTARVAFVRRAEARVRPLSLLRRHVDLERIAVTGAEITLDVLDGQLQNVPLPKREPKSKSSDREPWRVTIDRIDVHQTDVNAVLRGGPGPEGAPLRKVLGALAALRGRPPPEGATTLVLRLAGIEVDVRRGSKSEGQREAPYWDLGFATVTGAVDAPGLHESLGRLRTRARLTDAGLLTVDHLEVNLNQTEVALLARGVAMDVFALLAGRGGRVDGKVVLAVDVGAARRAFPKLPPFEGVLKVDIDAGFAPPNDWKAEGRVEWQGARVAEHRFGDLRVALEVDRRGARFKDLRTEFAAARLRGSGGITFEESPRVNGQLSFDNLQLSRLLKSLAVKAVPVDLLPSGRIEVKGRLVRRGGRFEPDLVAQTQIVVRDFIVRKGSPDAPKALFVPDARVDGRVRLRGRLLTFEGMQARIGRSEFRVRGTIDIARERLSIDTVAPALHLESMGTLAGIPWSGKGTVRAGVRGSFSRPTVQGSFDLEGLSFMGYDLDRAAGQVDVTGKTLSFPMVAVARGASRILGSFALKLDDMFIDGDFDLPHANTRDLMKLARLPAIYGNRFAADLSGEVRVRGRLPRPQVWGQILARDAHVYDEPIHEVWVKAAYVDGGVALETLRVRKTPTAGDLLVTGTVSRGGVVDLHAVGRALAISTLQLTALKTSGLEGDIDLKADVSGPLKALLGKGQVFLRNAKLNGTPHKDTRIDLSLREGKLFAEAKLFGDSVAVDGDLALAAPYPFSAKVRITELDLGAVAGPAVGRRVRPITGQGEVVGLLSKLDTLRGQFALTQFRADIEEGYSLVNQNPLAVRLEKGRVKIESFALTARDTALKLTGSMGLAGDLNLNVDGRADMRLLGFFVPKLQRPAGSLRFNSSIKGTASRPVLLGKGDLKDGRIGVEVFPHEVTDLEAKLDFSQGRIALKDLKGRFADGTVTGGGELVLDPKQPRFRVGVTIAEAELRFPEDVPSRVAGNLVFEGNFSEQVLSGEVQVLRARYTEDFRIEDLLFKKRRPVIEKPYDKQQERLRFNIHVTARDDLRVINNVADLEFQADVWVRGSSQRVGLGGAVKLARPGTVKILKKVFKVERCFAIFNEAEGYYPRLDCEMATRVRNIDVVFAVRGPALEPVVKPDCGASLSASDCFSLVQVGLTQKELNAIPGRSSLTTGVDALLNITGFDEKVAENLPIFDTFRIASGYSEYSGTVVPLVTIGKEFYGLRLYGTTSLIEPSKDFRLQAGYELGRNVSVGLEWVPIPRSGASGSSVGSSLGNLGVDLRWRFEF